MRPRTQSALHARADRRRDLADAMVATLRGVAPRGGAAVFAGCSLSDFELLGNYDLPRGVRLASMSSDWPLILTDAFTKRLLDHYRNGDPIVRRLTRTMSLRDFREATLVRVGDFPQLQRVGEGGEVQTGYIADGGERIALVRFARIFSLSATAFTNDDLRLFDSTIEVAANAALFAEGSLFTEVLLSNSGAGPVMQDGVAFFDASRGNVVAGAAPSVASLGVTIAALRKQRAPGEGAQPLNLAPRYVLVGPDNEIAARQAVVAITPASRPAPLDVLVDAQLGLDWYVFADPATRPAFVRGHLLDSAEPSVIGETSWEHDGPRWKVTHNIAIRAFEPRAVVRNPGA